MPLSIGDKLGPYEILGPLGAGGMGEVYRARDRALGREAAIKVVGGASGANASRRFPEEARLAASLNHPNIVMIYGLGEEGDVAYIAMELVKGRTLRALLAEGALPVARAMHLGIQVAEALAAAHAGGVVHRDLKPENIMVTADDRVKVLDFGLAKRPAGLIADGETADEVPTETRVTAAGVVVGTIGYMAPEQAAGKPVGRAADQFSFGAILYEMLSGQRAFKRETAIETLAAILSESPAVLESLNPAVPKELQEIVERCLAKAPGGRYPETADLVAHLRDPGRGGKAADARRWSRRRAIVAGGAVAASVVAGAGAWKWGRGDSGIRVLAVVPFENAAKDEDAEFLCEGMTKSLIRQLLTLSSLVVKRGPKGRIADVQALGRQLKADAVVTGSIGRRAGKMLVSVEVVDARTGGVLWSSPSYDLSEAELLRTQDEIALRIIDDGIRMKLSGEDRRRLGRRSTGDAEAMQLYMRALYLISKETETDYLAARPLLLQAVERDKKFALAYRVLAMTYATMVMDGYIRPAEAWPLCLAYTRQALSLDSTLPEPHSELGVEALSNRWNWAEAEREFELASRAPEPDVWMPYVLEQWAVGKNEAAIRLTRKALEADPVNVQWRLKYADLCLQTRQSDTAEKVYEGLIADDGNDPRPYFPLAEVKSAQGRYEEAIGLMRRGYVAEGLEDEALLRVISEARGAEGYRRVAGIGAQLELDNLADRAAANKYASPLDYARAHARLGDKDEAFRYLDAALADRSPALVFLKVDRAWDSIRKDARFGEAVKRIGIP